MQDLFEFVVTLTLQGYLGLFLACFIINMIPFISPSNMVLAGVASLLLPWMDWISIGLIVALSATLSKVVYYLAIRGSRTALSEKRLESLDRERARVEKWGIFALFIAASTPVPDDPLIIYVGFLKYNFMSVFASFFLGKLPVTLAGALLGYTLGGLFESTPLIIGSIALTAIITGFLFKRKTEDIEPELYESAICDEESPPNLNSEV